MIHEITILLQLKYHTFSVVVRLTHGNYFRYAVLSVTNELAHGKVEDVWGVEILLMVSFIHTHYLLLVRVKVLVEEYESSLIVEVNLIYDLC